MSEGWIKFNLNNYVRFKPTQYGALCWAKYWTKFEPYDIEAVRILPLDENGWAKVQAHEFAHILGPYLINGGEKVCETEIEIQP